MKIGENIKFEEVVVEKIIYTKNSYYVFLGKPSNSKIAVSFYGFSNSFPIKEGSIYQISGTVELKKNTKNTKTINIKQISSYNKNDYASEKEVLSNYLFNCLPKIKLYSKIMKPNINKETFIMAVKNGDSFILRSFFIENIDESIFIIWLEHLEKIEGTNAFKKINKKLKIKAFENKFILDHFIDNEYKRFKIGKHSVTFPNYVVGKIINNPYTLIEYDIPFEKADEIAFINGIKVFSEVRMQHLIDHVYFMNLGSSTMLEKSELVEHIKKFIEEDNGSYPIEMDIDVKAIFSVIKKFIEDKKLYLVKDKFIVNEIYYNAELYISEFLIENSKKNDALQYDDPKVFENKGYTKNQSLAISEITKNNLGLSVLIGSAGTGKTYTLKEIIKNLKFKYNWSDDNFLLLAPTGIAKEVMERAVGIPAFTIHSVIQNYINSKSQAFLNKYTCFIIDELSMVDSLLLFNILKLIGNGRKVILVGDSKQLPSISPGNCLEDISNYNNIHLIELDVVKRQSKDSDILAFINDVIISKNGINAEKDLLKYKNISMFNMSYGEVNEDSLEDKYSKDDNQILACSNRTCYEINTYFQEKAKKEFDIIKRADFFDEKSLENIEEYLLEKRIQVGDKVMNTKNLRSIKAYVFKDGKLVPNSIEYIANGKMGRIYQINKKDKIILVKFDDFYTIYSYLDVILHLDIAYSITIHKSQGKGWNDIFIYLENEKMMNNNIIYTAVTRARNNAIIGTNINDFNNSIKISDNDLRNTYLSVLVGTNE